MSVTPASQRPLRYSSFIDVGNNLNVLFDSASNPTENQVTDMIDKADSWIEGETRHSWLTNQTVDEYHDPENMEGRPDGFILFNWPVLSVVKLEWWDSNNWQMGREGYPTQYSRSETFLVDYPNGWVRWYVLRLAQPRCYRVTYNWGYPTVPDFIRDLSSRKAALLVLDFWAGKTMPAEDVNSYRKRFSDEIAGLLDQAIKTASNRPSVATA